MVADFQQPYIYAIKAPESGSTNGTLLFINVTNGTLIKSLPIGSNPIDLTINAAENKLYVLDYSNNVTYRVDLSSQTLLSPFNLGTNLSTISGVNSGRLLLVGKGQYTYYYDFVNTANGTLVVAPGFYPFSDGDGEVDSAGAYYYLGSAGSWPPVISKWLIQNDYLGQVGIISVQQLRYVNGYGSHNLILSHDNTRVFYNGNAYDANLNNLAWLGSEVYACSANGAVVFSSNQVVDGTSWLPMYKLPVTSTVMAVDGKDQNLWYYNSSSNTIESLPLPLMEKPIVLQQPTNQTIMSGNTAVIGVLASGRSPLFYNWHFNGTNIAFTSTNQISIPNFQAANAGDYSLVITNTYGSVISSNALVAVSYVPPMFTNQPANLIIPAGSNATLSASAIGSLPISYQWRINGLNIAGATNPVLNLTNLQLTDEGNYDVVATNAFGSTNSSSAFLNVVDLADALNTTDLNWITGGDVPWQVEFTTTHDGYAALRSGVITSGQQSILQTTVSGPGTLTFWWNIDSMFGYGYNFLIFSVNGAEQARISFITGWLPVTNYLGAGEQVVQWTFTQPVDSAVSPVGYVDQVSYIPGGTSPFVTLNPTNQVVLLGSNATLNAAALGTPLLSYQWQLNGANLDGATNTSLSLTNAQFANEGNYGLVISNAFGVTNTTPVFVNVVDFTESLNATNLTWNTGGDVPWFPETSITHDGVAALQSGAIGANQQSALQTTVNGPGTLSFWWSVSSETDNDYVSFSLDGVEQSRISGAVNWQPQIYYLTQGTHTLLWDYSKNATVNGGSDAAWLDQVSYTNGVTPAFIIFGPTNLVLFNPCNAVFTAVAQGTPPLFYQWQFNGTNIDGATNPVLSLASWSDEGSYSVIVSNANGAVVSSNATLTLLRSQIVGWGQDFYGQTNIPAGLGNVLAISAGGNNSMALKSDGTVAVWGDNSQGQKNIPSYVSNVIAISCGSFYDCLALKSDGTAVGWGLNGFGKATVPAGLSNIVAIAAGDNHSMVLLSNRLVIAWGSNGSGQTNVPAGLTNAIAIAAGSAHNLALRADGTVVAWGNNSSGQTNVPAGLTNVIAVAACGNDSLALQSNGVVVAWGNNSSGQTNVPAGLTNVIAIAAGASDNMALRNDGTVMVWGDNNFGQRNPPAGLGKVVAIAVGQSHCLSLLNDGPPIVAVQPHNLTNYAGFTIAFKASVLGLHPLTYQWQFDGTNICNASNSLLILGNIQPTNAGNYVLIVSNNLGVALSSNATLTVITNTPFLTLQPTNQTGIVGSNVTFSVGVGAGPIPNFYQWQFNGTNIIWATNATLTLTNVQTSDQGNYSVVVDNGYGAVTSSNAYLTVIVLDLPTALNTPGWIWTGSGNAAWFPESSVTHDGSFAAQSGVIANNQKSTLQTSVTGPGILTFWWRFSWQPFDSLYFYANGSLLAYSSFGFDWQQKTFYLGSGDQTLQWTYSRSSFPFGNMSTGWVDQVSFTPGFSSPIVLTPPSGQEVPAGTNVTFQVTAVGTPPLTYQWQFNSTNIPGAIGSSFTMNDVQTNIAGDYTVIVSNNYGITNVDVMLLVDPSSPAITIQPVSQKLPIGNPVTFSSGASGSEPIFYQWQHNNADIAGTTNAALVINTLQPGDAGSYHLVASNAFGFARSSDAMLSLYSLLDLAASVNAPSLNWTTFGDATWFPQTNTTHDGISAAQSGQLGFPQTSSLQTTVTGPGTLTFWWKVSCYNSSYVGLNFFINSVGQATIQGEVDWQQKSYYLGEGTQTLLWIYFNNTSASSGQNAGWVDQVSFTPGGTPPTLTSMSPNAFVRANSSANFVVSAYGTPPLVYQWQVNSVNLLNKTNASLSLANVQPTNAGVYTVVITNNFGVIATNAALWVGQFAFNPNPPNMFVSTNGCQLELDGILTTNPVLIWGSTDLVNWLPLFTNSATTGSVQLLDVLATNIPVRFYRAQE